MEATNFDAAQMERLAMCALIVLQDAERVASGQWVEVIHYCPRRGRQSTVVPTRVATYLCKALGEEQALAEAGEVEFKTKGGTTGRLRPSEFGLVACNKALIAWLRADMRHCRRMIKRSQAKVSQQQKGGPTL